MHAGVVVTESAWFHYGAGSAGRHSVCAAGMVEVDHMSQFMGKMVVVEGSAGAWTEGAVGGAGGRARAGDAELLVGVYDLGTGGSRRECCAAAPCAGEAR